MSDFFSSEHSSVEDFNPSGSSDDDLDDYYLEDSKPAKRTQSKSKKSAPKSRPPPKRRAQNKFVAPDSEDYYSDSFSDIDSRAKSKKKKAPPKPKAKPKRQNSSDTESEYSDFGNDYDVEFTDSSDSEYDEVLRSIALNREPRRNATVVNYGSDDENSEHNEEEDQGESVVTNKPTTPQIQKIIGDEIVPSDPPLFFVRQRGEAYIHSKWMTEEEVMTFSNGQQAFGRYKKKKDLIDTPCDAVPNLKIQEGEFLGDFMDISRILAFNPDEDKYLVRWESLTYDDCTWESGDLVRNNFGTQLEEFQIDQEKFQTYINEVKPPKPHPSEFKEWGKDIPIPEFKGGKELRDYQVAGVNWLRNNWYYNRSVILGDEMGLGKTVMGATAVNDINNLGIRGPFLIVAPLTTLPQWEREFHNWSNLNVILYHGSKLARDIIKTYEIFVDDTKSNYKFDVIITNYETLLLEEDFFLSVQWEYCICDEAHRLKNPVAKIYQLFERLQIKYLLFMTGTPMQNNLEELWALLHLLDPKNFPDCEDFVTQYPHDEEHMGGLRHLLEHYMLRRLKNDVETEIGQKEETIVQVALTPIQREYYKLLCQNNSGDIVNTFGDNKTKISCMANLSMQLRNVCNHPYLVKFGEPQLTQNVPEIELPQRRIDVCGKLVFLDKLLGKLRQEGAKILIFSQMVRMLNILEDYLHFRGYSFERIDGSTRYQIRQTKIDKFNDKTQDIFIFLLCTRAAGVGLNLTAANTVIIYDSDWNPQNDVQAMARCHRIGQKQDVRIYRLITSHTYEAEMFDKASKKLALDQIVLDIKTQGPESKQELEDLLANGVYGVFKEDDQEGEQFMKADLEDILQNRTKRSTGVGEAKSQLSTIRYQNTPDEGHIKLNDIMSNLYMTSDAAKEAESGVRTRSRRAVSESESSLLPQDYAFEWSKAARNRALTGFRRFGWGRWEEIRRSANLKCSVIEVQNVCAAFLYLICGRHDSFLTKITGSDFQLSSDQLEILRNPLFSDPEFKEKLKKDKSKQATKLLALNEVHQWFNNGQQRISQFTPMDYNLLKGVATYGLNNWEDIFDDEDLFPRNVDQKSIRGRLNDCLNRLKSGGKMKKSSSSRRRKHHDHQEMANLAMVKQKEKQEKSNAYQAVINALELVGEPINDAQWSLLTDTANLEGEFDVREMCALIVPTLRALVVNELESTEENAPIRKTTSREAADKVYKNILWFREFREFYQNDFENVKHRLSEIEVNEEWWNPVQFEPVLFGFIFNFGFTHPIELIKEECFSSLIPPKTKKLLQKGEQSIDFQPPLDFFIKPPTIILHIKNVIFQLTTEAVEPITLEINQRDKMVLDLPRIIGTTIIQSIGDPNAKFRCMDGYLFRAGFLARVRYGGSNYTCSIDQSVAPFIVQKDQLKVFGKTPLEAWTKILEIEPTENTFELFGLGLPYVRYWLQQQLKKEFVIGYVKINFTSKGPAPTPRIIPHAAPISPASKPPIEKQRPPFGGDRSTQSNHHQGSFNNNNHNNNRRGPFGRPFLPPKK